MQKYRRGLVFIFLSLKKNKILFLYMIIDEIWTAIFIRIIYILWDSNVYIVAIIKEDLIFDSVLRTGTGDDFFLFSLKFLNASKETHIEETFLHTAIPPSVKIIKKSGG